MKKINSKILLPVIPTCLAKKETIVLQQKITKQNENNPGQVGFGRATAANMVNMKNKTGQSPGKNHHRRLFRTYNSRLVKILLFMTMTFIVNNYSWAQLTLKAEGLQISIDNTGKVVKLVNTTTSIDYQNRDTVSFFISLISGGERHNAVSVKYNPGDSIMVFGFDKSKVRVDVKFTQHKTHLTFEVIKAEPAALVDAIAWGPLYTGISEKIGEVVGVVRDHDVSVGMLLLNAKTLGGHYNKSGVCEDRGSLALPWKSGSSLQAYSLNRDKYRFVDAMGHANIPLNPIKGETATGSKIALFSCAEPNTLDVIEKIILAEGLPYPTVDGIWTKKAFLHSRSYLISDFKESEIDQVIVYAKRGGFFSVYHEGPFSTWGHFELDTAFFPNGKEGIKICAEKAREAGLFFGVHTLTNFITPNDPYITPVPDQRLAITGYGFLQADIDSSSNEILVSSKTFFEDTLNNNMHTVMIGSELIRYKSVSEDEPFTLFDCQRGAFGTIAGNHSKGDTVKKLIDHTYKVFFPNIDMQREIAVNLAKFFNETGISHLDFDGHEGCFASGEGDYASCLFAEDFYKTIDHEFVNGTSRSKPYYWYINTLCNWGEPWYGGFKESMQEYSISNQAMLERNFFPNMLGWYMLTKNTTLPEMEWMLARAAGWNAGFAMVIRTKAIESNPSGMVLLDAIHEWETARLSGAFTAEQQERLKNSRNEFHLEKIKDREWNLYQFETSVPFVHEKIEKQTGEPTSSTFEFDINSFPQKLRFIIEITGKTGTVNNFNIQIDNYTELTIPTKLKAGEALICDGSDIIRIYDEQGKLKSTFDFTNKIPTLDAGGHQLTLDAVFTDDEPLKAKMIVKWMKYPERVSANN